MLYSGSYEVLFLWRMGRKVVWSRFLVFGGNRREYVEHKIYNLDGGLWSHW